VRALRFAIAGMNQPSMNPDTIVGSMDKWIDGLVKTPILHLSIHPSIHFHLCPSVLQRGIRG
jgi:hypothetical protein